MTFLLLLPHRMKDLLSAPPCFNSSNKKASSPPLQPHSNPRLPRADIQLLLSFLKILTAVLKTISREFPRESFQDPAKSGPRCGKRSHIPEPLPAGKQ